MRGAVRSAMRSRVVRAIARPLVAFVVPDSCLSCGASLTGDRQHLCALCLSRVVPRSHTVRLPVVVAKAGWSPAPAYYLLPFEGPSRALIHALKYGRRTSTAGVLVALMAPALRDLPLSGVDVVVPVPLHAVRRRERGFNQAELLAEELAGRLGLPTRNGLRRTRSTASQADLPREARMSNVSGAFVADHRAVRGERVLLLDDVVTTGATLSEGAAALEDAGAESVVCLAFAGRVRDV